MLTITQAQADAITAIDRTRADGGLGVTFDGSDYLVRDVRQDAEFADYHAILATARPYGKVTPRQARLALQAAGLLSAVTAWIAQADAATQIEWEFANEIRRDWPPIAACATALGLTDTDLDALFAAAGAL